MCVKLLFVLFLFFIGIFAKENEKNETAKDRFYLFGSFVPPISLNHNPSEFTRTFDTQCFLPQEGPGRCVPIERCPFLSDLSQRGFSMQSYRCAFSPSTLFVCCTDASQKVVAKPTTEWSWPQESTEQKASEESTFRPEEFPVIKEKPNRKPTPGKKQDLRKTQHRNRRLLPESSCGINLSEKVLGGEETGLNEYTWMALLRYRFSGGRTVFGCGGSIISEKYVLSAAHCLKSSSLPPNVVVDKVRLGEHDLRTEIDCVNGQCNYAPQDIDIEERIIHPRYDPDNEANYDDIALLRLRYPAKFNAFVSPICLPMDELKSKSYVGKFLDVAGWGRTANAPKSNSPIKLKVGLPVLSNKDCDPFYRRNGIVLIDSQICAGGESGKDSCQGDSGGPLMSVNVIKSEVRWHVTGIVSFGPPQCGKVNNPAVYTRVSSFIDWILDNIKE